jgi:Ni/Co efflux regulator RcnB
MVSIRPTRLVAVLVAQALLLTPVLASADGEKQMSKRQTCNRLTHQIDHFEGKVLKMAQERDNALWEKSTQQHVERLKSRRADNCPQYAEERRVLARAKAQAEQMQKLVAAAAKGAAKYFSGGWY